VKRTITAATVLLALLATLLVITVMPIAWA
jgi:hypothetical protein